MNEEHIEIAVDKFEDEGVVQLLEEHLSDMHANSPPGSVHALDIDALRAPSITFWCARVQGRALGCIALKELNAREAEIKSMRTTVLSRGKGIASLLLNHLLAEAGQRGYQRLYLETGSMDFFKPAHALYEKFGFRYRGPFGTYAEDPNSLFMELRL
ncbi:putative acetyltransferase [Microbulbifer donghaiensis]|uniref:Putative acetyltransferase n=1 Tax=Microbulbifer donghaiensis TaxID=494016 RepID=A0A1M5EML8_9GAMM|nr:GNAT family N-acetyltransferase [Microbulbifer donghaiensis]SHF80426.1 putative acetyltransferase [Microbulbifer donghaiensis]